MSWWQDKVMVYSKGRFWKSLLLSTDFFGTAANHISEIVLVNNDLKGDIIKRCFHLHVGRVCHALAQVNIITDLQEKETKG